MQINKISFPQNSKNGLEIVNAFADHFTPIFNVSSNQLTVNLNEESIYDQLSILIFQFSINHVLKGVNNIDPNKSPWPDCLASQFLTSCSFSVARPIWLIFNNSIQLWNLARLLEDVISESCNQIITQTKIIGTCTYGISSKLV